jgi:hypothetical protein
MARVYAEINAGGDAILSGTAYDATAFGFVDRVVTLYVEGINATSSSIGEEITVSVDHDGDPQTAAITDKVRVLVVDVKFEAVTPNSGFDDTINPTGLIVPMVPPPAVGTNKVKMTVAGAAVNLRSTNPNGFTLPPGPYSPGVHEVVVTSAGNTLTFGDVQAYMPTDDQLAIATVRVMTLPERTVRVKFFNVSDQYGHASTLTEQDANEILTVIADIWLKQANVKIEKATANWFQNLVLPANENYGDVIQAYGFPDAGGVCLGGGEAYSLFAAHHDASVSFNIFLVWEAEADCPPDDDPTQDNTAEAFTFGGEGGCVGDQNTTPNTNAGRGEVYAHEIGHHFSYHLLLQDGVIHFEHTQYGIVGNPSGDWNLHSNLMRPLVPVARQVTLRQAWLVNESLD